MIHYFEFDFSNREYIELSVQEHPPFLLFHFYALFESAEIKSK